MRATADKVAAPVGALVGMISGLVQGAYSVVEGATTLVFHPIQTGQNIGYAITNYDKTADAIYQGLKGRTAAVIYADGTSFISAYNAGVAIGQTAFDVCTVACTIGAGVAVKGTQVAKVSVDVSNTANKAVEIEKLVRVLRVAQEAKIVKTLNSATTKLLSSAEREAIASAISDASLKNTFNALYQASDQIPGGTAGAVLEEFKTGKLLSNSGHIIKANGRVTNLENTLKAPGLSSGDTEIATILLNQLKNALSLVKK